MKFKRLKSFRFSDFMKVMSLNSLSVFFRMLSGFVTVKLIAVYLGPTAMAYLGNFRNFITALRNVTTLGFELGVVKYVAETRNDEIRYKKNLSTSFYPIVITSCFLGVLTVLFSKSLSQMIFQNSGYYPVLLITGITLPMYAIHVYLMSILNGLKEFKKYILINIYGSIINIGLTFVLIWKYNLTGALVSLALLESLLFVFTVKILIKNQFICKHFFDKSLLQQFFHYSMMSLVAAVLSQGSMFLIRNQIIQYEGIVKAGEWETVNRISAYYLLVMMSGLSLYFLPRFAEINKYALFKIEIKRYFLSIVPITFLIFLLIFFARELVIILLLDSKFLPVKDLIGFQLIADFLKILSYAFSYQFLAKKMIKEFMISEILFFVVYFIFVFLLLPIMGVKGVLISYGISYAVYFIVVYWLVKKYLKFT